MIAHVIHPRCESILQAKAIRSNNSAGFDISEFYHHMDCDTIELMPNPLGFPFMLWVDEEGRYKNREVNGVASILAGEVVVGTAILTGGVPFLEDLLCGQDD